MNTPQIIYQVDAFTTEPFKGNPAGVCILDHEPPVTWMQNIAMEMNLSETAFVWPGENSLTIRFYTPEAEIHLCGHATLSASHILFETRIINSEEIRFSSKAGELIISSEEEIRKMSPHFSLMKNSEFGDLIITAPSSDKNYDFCVRCFAPALGINEDPVTGSAHCALAPFWSLKRGKNEFVSHQVSKREGILKVSLKGERVEISGQAKTIFKAELFV